MSAISIIIPVHNEERNIPLVFEALSKVFATQPDMTWDLVFVDDGSRDRSLQVAHALAQQHAHVHYIELSRNFGKEIATTAGLHYATGDAVIMMDADLQHPPTFIPTLLHEWQQGADVVIGVRTLNKHEGWFKKLGSWGFNLVMSWVSEVEMVPRETDFRLISRPVLDEFKRFTERDRMTRALLNWLGFKRVYVEFAASERAEGKATYSPTKLIHLALSYFLSHTQILLKMAGYLGMVITVFSSALGFFIFVEKYLLNDPWHMNFSGPAILAVVNMFFAGVILSGIGLVALHIGTIQQEAMNRPLYVIRDKKT